MSEALDEDSITISPQKLQAIYEHSRTVYMAMQDEAKHRADGKVIYTGFLTRLVKKEGLSTPVYTHVTQLLKDMGCVTQLKRGGGGTMSSWHLIREPSVELYLRVRNGTQSPLGNPFGGGHKYEELVKRVAELAQLVSECDGFMIKTSNALVQLGLTIQAQGEEIKELRKQIAMRKVSDRVGSGLDLNI